MNSNLLDLAKRQTTDTEPGVHCEEKVVRTTGVLEEAPSRPVGGWRVRREIHHQFIFPVITAVPPPPHPRFKDADELLDAATVPRHPARAEG